MWRLPKDETGYAMAEVVVAAAILMVAALLVGGLLVQTTRDEASAAKGMQAVYLAQEKAEEIKGTPFAEVKSEPWEDVPGFSGFRRRVDVEVIDAVTKRVTVAVSYPVSGGTERKVLVLERTVDF